MKKILSIIAEHVGVLIIFSMPIIVGVVIGIGIVGVYSMLNDNTCTCANCTCTEVKLIKPAGHKIPVIEPAGRKVPVIEPRKTKKEV